jgi:hypothetical protein
LATRADGDRAADDRGGAAGVLRGIPPVFVSVPPVNGAKFAFTWTKPQPAVKPVARMSRPVMLIEEPMGWLPRSVLTTI